MAPPATSSVSSSSRQASRSSSRRRSYATPSWLQQTAYETRPDFIIETGTWQGGSALWWAQTLSGMGLDQARVFTVDIQDLTRTASLHPLWKKHVEFLPGSYIAVEDTHLDGIPTHPEQGPGPTAAIRRFLAEAAGKDFEQDFTREALIMTSYPGGWLRRRK